MISMACPRTWPRLAMGYLVWMQPSFESAGSWIESTPLESCRTNELETAAARVAVEAVAGTLGLNDEAVQLCALGHAKAPRAMSERMVGKQFASVAAVPG